MLQSTGSQRVQHDLATEQEEEYSMPKARHVVNSFPFDGEIQEAAL